MYYIVGSESNLDDAFLLMQVAHSHPDHKPYSLFVSFKDWTHDWVGHGKIGRQPLN